MGLIDEILHILIRQYELQNPGVMQRALHQAREQMGAQAFEQAQLRFLAEFPPLAVYHNRLTEADYLNGETAGRPHRQTTLEEMLILNVTNQNPAVQPYKELFDDEPLRRGTVYEALMHGLAAVPEHRTRFRRGWER